jgi:asparagine synthase (glutamine-hydrolysing)
MASSDPTNRPIDPEILRAMNGLIQHRGPDDGGFHLAAACGLGHRRLSIIDLSTGQQPMANEDGSCWIVFNGEIYNHHELREGLLARGHVFKTRSDTEAILHLYEEKVERCVEDLRGMFPFAIWNERTQELFLARDRVGKKPLFYTQSGGQFIFASELKALLAHPAVGREVDPAALDDYLALQYVPAPRTIFKGVQKLPPAHTLTWRGGKVSLRRYWTLDYEPKTNISEADACDYVRELIDEAVRIRLESEVPLGFLLSGGIDSSAVVAFARRRFSGDLRTFSIGFEEASHNELPYARTVARQFGTIHEELVVRPEATLVIPKMVWHFDEPFADSSGLPSFYVAKMTRRHVTVALNGDGGDESFAGYTRYLGMPRVEAYRRIPRPLRAALGPLARAGHAALPFLPLLGAIDYLNERSLATPGRLYAYHMTIFHERERRRLLAAPLRQALDGRDALTELLDCFERPGLLAEVDRKMFTDVMTYLPGDLLVKMDRMCMAHGLEARSPLLDHKLMEAAARLPAELKFKGREQKYLLKKALEPILPREIMYRPKQGFAAPIGRWFRGELSAPLREVLLSDRARGRGFFNAGEVGRLVSEHLSGRVDHHHRLWALLCFEVWCRTFLDRSPTAGPIVL